MDLSTYMGEGGDVIDVLLMNKVRKFCCDEIHNSMSLYLRCTLNGLLMASL